jgi:hypothetical protein
MWLDTQYVLVNQSSLEISSQEGGNYPMAFRCVEISDMDSGGQEVIPNIGLYGPLFGKPGWFSTVFLKQRNSVLSAKGFKPFSHWCYTTSAV